ncbi:phosphopantetheine binding protein, partial [Murinocardiopsis flavida]
RTVPVDYASHSPHVEPLGAELRSALAGIAPRTADIPFYSTVHGRTLDGSALTPEYWYANLRQPVLFAEATRALIDSGCTTFIEVSPHPVLTYAIEQTAEAASATAVALPTLRRDDAGPSRFAASLAQAHLNGAPLDWDSLVPDARPVDLPTYAFEHHRYWLGTPESGDAAAAGLAPAGHPLLEAAIPPVEGEGHRFSGRVSTRDLPWLADHAITGTPLLPGTAFLELALHAGELAGCPRVAELTLNAPLALPDDGRVQVRVTVEPPDGAGERALHIHSRPEPDDDAADPQWTRNAEGAMAPAIAQERTGPAPWPPPGAEPVPTDGAYAHLAERGYDYGPAFQGLRAAWLVGDDICAEVRLPADQRGDADAYGIHPALLDAAQHALVAQPGTGEGASAEPLRLPFSYSGVTLHATGATDLRVRVSPTGAGTVSLHATDPAGAPVLTVASLTLRAAAGDHLASAARPGKDDLFTIEWAELPAPAGDAVQADTWAVLGPDALGLAATLDKAGLEVDAYPEPGALAAALADGAPVPATVLLPCVRMSPDEPVEAIHTATHGILALLQQWLADDRFAATRLAVVTHGAVATRTGEDVPDLVHSPLWGLVRAAQSENPDRLVLVDIDEPHIAPSRLTGALASGEPQVAVRSGVLRAPRIARARAQRPTAAQEGGATVGDGTVLVTGATGTLGRHVARHLAARYGARHLLLVSRRGAAGEGTAEFEAELTGLGAGVTFAACDAADRGALKRVIDAVPADRPVTAVAHIAGVLDDGILSALTPERFDRVMRPKIDAALNLHELTSDLSAFLLFSSAAGTVGGPGQANYAAANTFLDALAHHRIACGEPAVSLAWGLWAQSSGMTGHLGDADLNRMARMGMARPLTAEEGLSLLDTAIGSGAAHLLPLPLDLSAVRADAAKSGTVPSLLRGLVRAPRRRAADTADGPALAQRLAGLPATEAEQVLVDVVREHAADVLGHASGSGIDPGREFLELGFDSLTAVEFRNRLNSVTGLRLPAALVFDHPSPTALARYLRTVVVPPSTGTEPAPGGDAPPAPAGGARPDAGTGSGESGSIVDLFRESCRQGRIDGGIRLVQAAADLRPTFATAAEFGPPASPLQLSRGPARPALIAFPSLVMVSGAQEYARFAAGLRELRDLTVLLEPGFAPGESLPAEAEAVIALQADAVRRTSGDDPFVLVGRSSGGWIAHAVAERLERLGAGPRAVALIDTPMPDDATTLPIIETGVVDRESEFALMTPSRVTAMGAYFRLFAQWRPGPLAAPTVLVRPSERFRTGTGTTGAESDDTGDWRFAWAAPHVAVEVPGDHLTMMEEHAEATARALHEWLAVNTPEE